jgi:hypothetical protein
MGFGTRKPTSNDLDDDIVDPIARKLANANKTESPKMQNFYWVRFADHAPGCVEAVTKDEAGERAAKFGKVEKIQSLPYPANPRLDVRSDCPSFCYSPESCAGRRACPKHYSCSS